MLGYLGAAADDIKSITESLTSSAERVSETIKNIKGGKVTKDPVIYNTGPDYSKTIWTATGVVAVGIAGYFLWKAYGKKK
jgi:hypothetical protein